MAVLRHLYGLSYPTTSAEFQDGPSLLPHALVYLTAHGYQINKLQNEASVAMKNIMYNGGKDANDLLRSSDLLEALRVIIAGTPTGDTAGREVLLVYCVRNLHSLAQLENFTALASKTSALGAELSRCQYAGQSSGRNRPRKQLEAH